MQPIDHSRRRLSTNTPPALNPFASAALAPASEPPLDFALDAAPLRIAAPALLIEARFGGLTLASRLLRADEEGTFTIGAGRGATAPVNPAWLGTRAGGGAAGEPAAYPLVTTEAGGFAIHLTPAMRAELRTPVQRLALSPDQGRAEAPLVLPADSHLYVPCGEVVFEIRASDPAPAVPRPWMPAGWRDEVRYPVAVALTLLVLIAVAAAVPSDPRALSLDDLGVAHRWDRTVTIPLAVTAPEIDRVLKPQAPGGGGAPAAVKPAGKAGDRKAREADARMAIKGTARPEDARAAAARIRTTGLLAVLDGQRTGAVADVLSNQSAMGSDAADVLGHLDGTIIGNAYGVGGLHVTGTGDGGAGTHEGTIGTGGLGTLGRVGSGPGTGRDYGAGAGQLGRRVAKVPDVFQGIASVRGSLDKEIIRRIVRRHVNEVRYCYDQALVSRPTLSGRVVVQFTIAGTGRVLASLLQSSTLGATAVDACIVAAVKRWEFPAPQGGGLVMVSYPFQLSPAGG